jgi:Fe-S-cluster containining protein
MWECSKCGACCKYAKCKDYVNGLCAIYETRPEICRVSQYDKEHNEDMLNKACELIRNKLKERDHA